MRRKRLAALLVVLLLLGAAGWWLRGRGRGAGTLPSAVVRRGDLSESVHCRGKLTARQAAVLVAPSRVQRLRILYLAPDGSQVTAGEVVVRLDVTALQQQEQELALALQAAQTQLDQARNQAALTSQQDDRTLAEDQAAAGTAEVDAEKESVKGQIAGQEARLALAVARAVVTEDQAQAKLHQTAAGAQLQSLTSARDKAAAQLRRAQDAVAAATLRAPLSGIISYSMNYANYNDLHPYRVGDTVSAGDEIGQIPNLQTLQVNATLAQDDRGQVRAGEAIEAQATALPETQINGQIEKISELTSLDFSGSYPPPRIFRLVATLTHPDPRLRAQMSVAVEVITRRLHNVALLPAQAVFNRGGQAVVYVQQGRGYQPRPIHVLGRNDTDVAVDGVVPGARVALLEPGSRPSAASPSDAAGATGVQP
ncbi:MAG: efflux RND transporter periplasmic adaptor subunit [Terriglobales bacterium]